MLWTVSRWVCVPLLLLLKSLSSLLARPKCSSTRVSQCTSMSAFNCVNTKHMLALWSLQFNDNSVTVPFEMALRLINLSGRTISPSEAVSFTITVATLAPGGSPGRSSEEK
jgi:hypothetical protein